MKKLLILLLLINWPLIAQNDKLFEDGNVAYNTGNYEGAIESYEQIINNGETSAAVYYNLANSHYKLNSIAPAVYYYEKALQLDPNDADINNNLAQARNLVIDDILPRERTSLSALWNASVSIFGYNGWAWTAIVFAFIFASLFILYYFSNKTSIKRVFFSLSILFIFLTLFSLIFAFQQKSLYSNNNYAIIFSQEAAVRDEPTLRSTESFYLHEGTKLRVLESYQNWIKFELENGLQGWMDSGDVRFF